MKNLRKQCSHLSSSFTGKGVNFTEKYDLLLQVWKGVVFRWSGMGSGTTVVTPSRISHSLAPPAMLKGGNTWTLSLPGPVLTKTQLIIFFCLS